MKLLPFVALAVFAASCSRPPEPTSANQSPHDAHGAAAPAAAARATLLGNLGSYHRAIKSASPEAQQFFDEGLALLYGFNHEESFKSFERAAALDPSSPMPHWGMSLALGTNINDVAPAPSRTVQTSLYHFARGAALDAKGQVAEAETELAALKSAAAKIPREAMVGAANTAVDVIFVAVNDLTARIAEAKGEVPAALKACTPAVAAEDHVGYNEPPDWLLPERERLGALLLKTGKFADAEKVFRADLQKNVGNPRSLFGLYRSLEGQRKYAVQETKTAFDKAWAGADVRLGEDLYTARLP